MCCYRRLSPFSHVRIRSRIKPASTAISNSSSVCIPDTSLHISSGSPASTLYHIRQDMSVFLRKGVDILSWGWYNVSVKDISGSSLIHERSQKMPRRVQLRGLFYRSFPLNILRIISTIKPASTEISNDSSSSIKRSLPSVKTSGVTGGYIIAHLSNFVNIRVILIFGGVYYFKNNRPCFYYEKTRLIFVRLIKKVISQTFRHFAYHFAAVGSVVFRIVHERIIAAFYNVAQ